MSQVIELLSSQDFLLRAFIVGVMISVCCALLGVSLVLKRFSMIGDGLSHVSFGAMAIGAAAGVAPLYFALPIVIASAFLLLRISEKGKIKGDAAIALISTGALAIGVMVTSMTTGMNVDIYNYMFGSILTMSRGDVLISCLLSVIVITLFVLFYHEIFAVTFDESFAKATGTAASVYNMLIAVLTAVTIVIGMKIMGAMLISSLIIFPTVTSMRLCKSYKRVVISSALISVFCFLAGLVLSVKYETPTGASVVCVNIFLLGVVSLIRAVKNKNFPSGVRIALLSVIIAVSVAVSGIFLFAGSSYSYKKDKTTIVTTAFAQYDFAKGIAGDRADVIMLLAPGEESHTYEPTPGDIMKIQQCDLFIYGGGESDHWTQSILDSLDSEPETVRMMEVVELYEAEHSHDEHHHHSHGNEDTEYDEHVWTSPLNAIEIVREISDVLQELDSINADYYETNTAEYLGELYRLDSDFLNLIEGAEKPYIIVGDRFPFLYFTHRYSLSYHSAFSGCSAQTETNPTVVARLIEKAKNENIDVIFKTDLSKGDVADTIAEAVGGEVMTLYSCHTVSASDFEKGETYISLMRRNLQALEAALY